LNFRDLSDIVNVGLKKLKSNDTNHLLFFVVHLFLTVFVLENMLLKFFSSNFFKKLLMKLVKLFESLKNKPSSSHVINKHFELIMSSVLLACYFDKFENLNNKTISFYFLADSDMSTEKRGGKTSCASFTVH